MRQQTDSIERDPFVDALRVASVLVVVLGHWMTTTVVWEDGFIDIENALSVIRSAHVATWLIQVMPVLFFVGGFANSRSLEDHGGNYLAYVRTRCRRLLVPTLVFVGAWLVVGILAEFVLDDLPNALDRAADLAALPFWFLGLYLFVVALAPPLLELHRHWGWWLAAGMATAVAAGDFVYHGLGVTQVGVLNHAFVWLLAHQLGFFYADGTLLELPRRVVALATASGLAGLVVLTAAGSYPVSMVGVPGDERWNTNPPSLALVVLTLWLVGLCLLLRPRILIWVQQRSDLLAGANRLVLTVFLWHVSAVAVAGAVLYPMGFPQPQTGTMAWWALRPVWIAALVPPLWLLVALFRRFEVHPRPRASDFGAGSARYLAGAYGVVSIGLGILGFGVTGFNRIAADLEEGVLGFELNPFQNVLHLVLGLALFLSAYRTARVAVVMASSASALYLAIGLLGVSDGIPIAGMNVETAWLHIALGSVGLVLVGWAGWHDRRVFRSSES